MTVHGAKGLEAPVVILADATADPARLGRTPLTVDIEVAGAGVAPLLRPKKDERCPPFEEIILAEEQRDLEEHLRLLYVALTRAADRLIVSGVQPKERKDGSDPRPPNSWHRIVEQAMGAIGAVPGDGHVALYYGSSIAARPRRDRGKARACQPWPFRTGRCNPRRPKRVRRARSRPRRSRSTTKPRRRRARRCAQRRCAEPGSTNCSSGCRQSSRGRASSGEPLARALGGCRRRGNPGRDRRAGLRNPVRSALRRRCSARIAWRSAARRDPARRPGDRRHGRSAAGRG